MCSAISSWSTSSRTAFTPWRTRASMSSFTSCSNNSCFGAKCLPPHSTHNLPDTIEQLRGLGAVADSKHLVGGAQMLFYGGLGEVQALAYLGVAHALDYQTQYLPLAVRQRTEVRFLLAGRCVLYYVL